MSYSQLTWACLACLCLLKLSMHLLGERKRECVTGVFILSVPAAIPQLVPEIGCTRVAAAETKRNAPDRAQACHQCQRTIIYVSMLGMVSCIASDHSHDKFNLQPPQARAGPFK